MAAPPPNVFSAIFPLEFVPAGHDDDEEQGFEVSMLLQSEAFLRKSRGDRLGVVQLPQLGCEFIHSLFSIKCFSVSETTMSMIGIIYVIVA